jgi:hypothetical protein
MPAKNRHRVYSKKETQKQKKRVFVKKLERVQSMLNPFAFSKGVSGLSFSKIDEIE